MAWALVQSKSATTGGATSLAVTVTASNFVSGNKIIAGSCTSAGAAVTTNSVTDPSSVNWTKVGGPATNGNNDATLWALDCPGADAGTKNAITANFSTTAGASVEIQEVSGVAAGNTTAMCDGTAATLTGTTSATGSPTYSTAAANEYEVCLYGDNGASATVVQVTGWTLDTNGQNASPNANCVIEYRNSVGGSETGGFTAAASVWELVQVAFLLPAGGVTYVPQRYGQPAPPSPAPWEQRSYRSIPGALDTPANPLASPLDTAWQADAQYSHLYADSHLRDRRAYFYQRPLVSDPNLLAAAPADPLLLNPEQSNSSDLWRVAIVPAFYPVPPQPQQPRRVSDPLLLLTAELENELLGGAETGKYYRQAATHYDRREVPQQRAYYDTTLLATAELENELLGGAETFKHYAVAATNAARWWMPQQPARLADPLLIATALLENELLGGAATWLHYITSAYIDRREVPQQRLYISDPSFYPPQNNIDPLLIGQDYLDSHQHQAATHYDRREVPQQRPYISDPSFYPAGAVTDPLTVAWGAGGPYWHLYNRAGDITDRREYFTQRLYQSDPLLLLSALLENELLGGAETGKYYRTPASHYARWWMPQQPARLADPLLIATALLENELLGGGGTSRYYLAAAYWDRREVPQQPARLGVQAPPVPLDPTQSAWAALWLAYNLAATHADRRLYPQQRLYFPVPLPPPPFTVGTLTAADAALAVLAAASGGTAGLAGLTATDQRTGGPA